MTKSSQEVIFRFNISELDPSLLPIDPSLLRSEPRQGADSLGGYFEEALGRDIGEVDVDFRGETITVRWKPRMPNATEELFNWAVGILKAGAYRMGLPVFAALVEAFPEESVVLFNYGMLLSDLGRLDEATRLLEKLTKLQPENENALNALGLAYQRKGLPDKALAALRKSHEIDPDNGYTLRNLGSLIAKTDPRAALPHLERAAILMPNDQAAQYGYALCLRTTGNTGEASKVFRRAIEISPYSEIAELCRQERTAIAHEEMRGAVGGGLRIDVVMYCLAAMKLFQELGPERARAVTFEIALRGRSGLDVNDPARKYRLNSLPGEFSGLQLVAYMYVGLKSLDPNQDAGIDFSREYAQAEELSKRGESA